ncbi:MAG: peptide chain release factor N(5)-glutamine methyltransferase [Chloroflexota bacterium]|nr:peptide chain release factor N(5)-glutamine methyltransferase [Chloroflexota bacterium]MBI5702717.1 peptide chain release factor N(5)-glutamine methyltransferase [Chloroflexota bacterium]
MPPLLTDLTTRLTPLTDTPALDASVLLAHLLGKPRAWVIAHPELTLTADQQKQLDDFLARLENGEPLPYVLGHWEFFGMDFDLTPDVLIPRPETELLVEKAIAWLLQSPLSRTVADVGTGSGIIAIAIAASVRNARLLATDISPQALQVAKRNAAKHRVLERIEFIECDLLPDPSKIANLQSNLNLLCANLPYIPTQTLHSLPIYGREPTLALDGGADGLDLIRRLLRLAPTWMTPNSLILLEIESTLGSQTLDLARSTFPHAEIQLHKDLSRLDRLLEIRL